MNMPEELGNYRLSDPLVQGEHSGLYRAAAAWGTPVLLDVLHVPEALSPTGQRIQQLYLRGARSLLQVQHPQLPRALDIHEQDDRVMLAFEDTLHRPLRMSAPVTLSVAHGLAQQLFGALKALHSHALLHTRLSPEALWINGAGEPVLRPPDLAAQALAEVMPAQATDPRYTPPEVQAGGAWTQQSDLYGLAATLWAGFSGRSLPTAAAREQGAGLPVLPLALQGSLLEQAMTQALHPTLAERAMSASEVLEQLGPAVPAAAQEQLAPQAVPAATAPAQATAAAMPPAASPAPAPVGAPRRWNWAGPVTAGLVLVAGALALRGLPSSDHETAAVALQETGTPAATVAPSEPAPTSVSVPAPEPVREPVRTDIVISSQLNLRSGPGGAASVLATVRQGDRLDVFSEQGGWSEVRRGAGGEMGWVKTELTLPLIDPARTQAVVDALQAGQSVQLERGVYWLERPLELYGFQGEIRGVGARVSLLMSPASQDTVRLSGGEVQLREVGIVHTGSAPARTLTVSGGHLTLDRVRLSGAVRDQDLQEYGSGLYLKDGSTASISKSSFEANAYGLYVADTSQANVTASNLSGNAEGGALWRDQSGGELRESAITKNGAHGVHITGTASPVLVNNEIRGNRGRGVTVYGDAGPFLTDNLVSRNGLQGIGVQDRAVPELHTNTVQGNAQSGLAYFDSAGGVAQGNHITENAKAGISVAEAAWPALNENEVVRNGTSGIAYADQSGGEAVANLIQGHPNPGISAWGDARPILRGNTVMQGKQSGIVFAERAAGELSGNTVQDQALYGLIVTDEAAPEVVENTFTSNRQGGMLFKRRAGVNAYGNRCEGNGGQDFGLELDPLAPVPQFDKTLCS